MTFVTAWFNVYFANNYNVYQSIYVDTRAELNIYLYGSVGVYIARDRRKYTIIILMFVQ